MTIHSYIKYLWFKFSVNILNTQQSRQPCFITWGGSLWDNALYFSYLLISIHFIIEFNLRKMSKKTERLLFFSILMISENKINVSLKTIQSVSFNVVFQKVKLLLLIIFFKNWPFYVFLEGGNREYVYKMKKITCKFKNQMVGRKKSLAVITTHTHTHTVLQNEGC